MKQWFALLMVPIHCATTWMEVGALKQGILEERPMSCLIMDFKKLALILSTIALCFVALGDRFLPSPMATYSFKARTTLNTFLIGLLPRIKPQNRNVKTEEAVDELNQQY